ncbi:ATP-grasp domain-containing protein [Pseudonocardia lacus]|uniref:ATP-grasp domain-containing protein n=1 Tax=Pseudonocardia lacus TaxID=2835865 RepID=UPI001BDD1479|nr:ATP-grasp domain-containing protein [Pseudonocardia lacus]
MTTTVLVTGVGGPAGISVVRSLLARRDTRVIAADMDRFASGLYLVPAQQRVLVPAGLAVEFVPVLLDWCRSLGVDVVFPTVDVELPIIAASRDEFSAIGVAVASPGLSTLEVCLDKLALADRCAGVLPVPRTEVLGPAAAVGRRYPVVVKPRRGAGSRGISFVGSEAELLALGSDDAWLVQDVLPGAEFSVDVFADMVGHVVAAVPRSRLRVDSGVSVAGATLHHEELEQAARRVATAIGLTTVANVQLRRDREGRAALLEVNPRFPGAMPLTIAAGIDMPSLTLDAVLGRPTPTALDFRDVAVVRYLEDLFLQMPDIQQVPSSLSGRAPAALGTSPG